MLYYSSIHPEWDQRSGFPNTLRARQISTLLDAISLNHYRNSASCFQALEQQGVILGNGGFETILLQQDPSGPLQALDPHWPETVSQTAARYLTIPLWYCFSVSGRLYVLCCFPRMREGSGEAKAMEQQLFQAFSSISSRFGPRPRSSAFCSVMYNLEKRVFSAALTICIMPWNTTIFSQKDPP